MTFEHIAILKDINMSETDYFIRHHDKGNIIFLSGEITEHLAIIIHGQAAIQHINEEGQLMTLNVFTPGQTFGGNRLFASDRRYPLTVIAKEATDIMYISKETILRLCQDYQSFLISFLEDVASKSDILSQNIRATHFMTIEDQVVSYLSKQVKLQGSYDVHLNISKKEWAEKMGIQRTSLSRVLQKMQKKGWLSYKNHHYILHDKTIFK